ncbi:MAG: hypothetical protein HUJ31_02720 [Pseudomonadales bacterium]|nr:hypothetical protein [Pseudomonadales bacterium]
MLTKGDDYPLHQTPEPVAYTANRNFYDRFFFNGYNPSGDIFFAAAMGVYPWVNVLDGAFSIVIDGVQHNVYGSRILHMERRDTRVGHVAVDIVATLRVIRVTCNDEANGIKADVTFTARTIAHEEPRFTRDIGGEIMMDVTRMTQFGTWQGWLEVKGRRIDITPEEFCGTRDRSWGIRTIGEGDPQPNPYSPEPQFYWLWAPLNFDEFATHWFVNDDAEGVAWNNNAVILPFDRDEEETMASSDLRMHYRSGTRHAETAEILFRRQNGEEWQFQLNVDWHFYMRGIGYTHPHWRHGTYHGELETGYDEFKVAEVDPTDLHIQAMCNVLLTTPDGEYKGRGILEQLIIGRHEPSGFKELMDMAP